jgi:hypothetical protein|tara:strand:- start:2402 stop:3013 length:612 start_codon:yes stop_codon:yes gene_type:complete
MPKKCPPGVICVENATMFFIVVLIAGLCYYLFKLQNGNNIIIKQNNTQQETQQQPGFFNSFFRTNIPYTNDVLLDPYVPPLRDNRFLVPGRDVRGAIPINVPTQGVDTNYRQVGLLTRINGQETILPLMGRPTITNRDKWNFYSMSDKNNAIKLPVTNAGKSCTSEYGCDNLYNGDTVYVEGYNDAFKVTMYDNNTIRYIPVL